MSTDREVANNPRRSPPSPVSDSFELHHRTPSFFAVAKPFPMISSIDFIANKINQS